MRKPTKAKRSSRKRRAATSEPEPVAPPPVETYGEIVARTATAPFRMPNLPELGNALAQAVQRSQWLEVDLINAALSFHMACAHYVLLNRAAAPRSRKRRAH